MDDVSKAFVIVLVISIAVFLILREFFCWYWKNTARLHAIEETNTRLNKMLEILAEGNRTNTAILEALRGGGNAGPVTKSTISGIPENDNEKDSGAFNQ